MMQESSTGKTIVSSDDESEGKDVRESDIPSAFHFVGKKEGKSSRPNSGSKRTEKRDSGYATDGSPGYFYGLGNNLSQFSFDLDHMDQASSGNSEEISGDKIDEEVEMVLFSQQQDVVSSISRPIDIPAVQRPSAPVPRAEEMQKSESLPTFSNVHNRHEVCSRRNRHSRHYFRPIESRSVGTQTPSPHSQIIHDAITEARFHPYLPNSSRVQARFRHFSEGENIAVDENRSPLPDLVQQVHRDRSVSLPNVPSLSEVEVGRELRRISDEFHFSYIPNHRRRSVTTVNGFQPSSFPGANAFNFQNWWVNLRQIFASPTRSHIIRRVDMESLHGSPADLDVFDDEPQ